MVLRMFHVDIAFIHEGSMLGIGFSLFVVVIAALNLLLDFDMIEKGVAAGAPKYMEWYGAFGLLVTIVWLYLEILRRLSKSNWLIEDNSKLGIRRDYEIEFHYSLIPEFFESLPVSAQQTPKPTQDTSFFSSVPHLGTVLYDPAGQPADGK